MDEMLVNLIKEREVFIDTSSLLCGQKDFLMLDLFDVLMKNQKKVLVLESAKGTLVKNESYAERKINSTDALNVLKQYEENGVVEYINNDMFAKMCESKSSTKYCFFIDEKNKLKELLHFIKNKNIEFYKMGDGKPVKWDFFSQGKVTSEKGGNSFMNNTKLLITFVIDNSSSMKGNKIEELKKAIKDFGDKINNKKYQNCVECAMIMFRGFESIQYKSFDQNEININNLYAGGIPFCSNALDNAINTLNKRVDLANNNGESLYKPWIILLLNGENYDDVKEPAVKLVEMMKSGKVSYFPFALSDNEFNPNLAILKKVKPFTIVKDAMYDQLFGWIFNLVEKRISTPADQSFAIDSHSFEGWTIK